MPKFRNLAIGMVLGAVSCWAQGRVITHLDAARIDAALRTAVTAGTIHGVVAMVTTPNAVIYKGAFGKRDVGAGIGMTDDTIFAIYSMTKPVTSVAAMQLIEQGKLSLDDPIGKWLPSLAKLDVLEGFENGKPKLRPAKTPVTVRQLLTHTSGFVYGAWNKDMRDYLAQHHSGSDPLAFDPGTSWEYGISLDKLGNIVEAVSGLSLEDYFQRNIFVPLGMADTSFNVPGGKATRVASSFLRQPNGSLLEQKREKPAPRKTFSGGGGLYSTAADYAKFMQMILRQGDRGKTRLLQSSTVDLMTRNQIGELRAGRLKTVQPNLSNDVDFHPGFVDKFGFGFLLNPVAYKGGRSAGSLAWAGLENTYFWIDPERKVAAVILMQILPFCDTGAIGVLQNFERSVYAGQ